MKKLFSALICLSLILGALALDDYHFGAGAEEYESENSDVFSSNSAIHFTAQRGDDIELSLYIKDSKAVSGIHCSFVYEEKAIEFGNIKTYIGTGNYTAPENGIVSWNTLMPVSGTDFDDPGLVCSLTFTALKDISSEENTLSYNIEEFFDTDLLDLDQSKAEIVSNVIHRNLLWGDADGDEEITADDAMEILRYSVGLSKLGSIRADLTDVNGDDSVDALDAVNVLRYSIGINDGFEIGKTFPI